MINPKQIILLPSILLLNVSLMISGAFAADQTWSGAGGNANWSTGANWGGTAPVSNDNLIFNGTSRQNNTNDIGNLTVGRVTFNNGGFVLNGNALTVSGVTPAFITNSAGTNIIACPLVT